MPIPPREQEFFEMARARRLTLIAQLLTGHRFQII